MPAQMKIVPSDDERTSSPRSLDATDCTQHDALRRAPSVDITLVESHQEGARRADPG
jgi:hypothetical protein